MYNFIIVVCIIKLWNAQYFDPLPLNRPYSEQNNSKFYNYGYWYKYQPLIQLSNNKRFGNSSNNIYLLKNQQLLNFELIDENTLSLWHYQTDSFNHIVNIVSSEGLKSYSFQQDQLNYEGQWNFFGIQIITGDQYQILFYSSSLKIIVIDGILNRKQEQDYYIGCYGTFFDGNSQQLYFQQFQGRLTDFIELPELVSESNFYDTVFSTYQSYINMFDLQLQQYFDILNFDGQSVKKYNFIQYREGIRYGLSMWVKSNIEQYTLELNYTILRVTLNEYYTDNYLGDRQLLIQYQIGVVPSENIVYVTTYSFKTPVYSLQKKNDKDWIKIQDSDLMIGLKQWHFIQFEYGRTSQPDASPHIYNSLFTLDLPNKNKQFNSDWNRDNHHFTGVPIYFYLGGGLSQYENKFIGMISKFKFISYNTENMQFVKQCNNLCLTCNGPTSSDCLTCSSNQNRVFSQNQCVCKQGYIQKTDNSYCELFSILYPMIEVLETEYKCPQGYDQCDNGKLVCSFGYFENYGKCYQCPLQPSEYQDNIINCIECVFLPTIWDFFTQYCRMSMQLTNYVFNQIKEDMFVYDLQYIDNNLELKAKYYQDLFDCPDGYGFDYSIYECVKCLNSCSYCTILFDQTQICIRCSMNYFLNNNYCIQCGTNCQQCNPDGCHVCQEGSFLTLDKINCHKCSILNCQYCFQYYQNDDQLSINLDLKYLQLDLTLDGIITSCARCNDGYAINGESCVQISLLSQFQIQACITGIIKNDKFQCLIGFDKDNSLQLNNCSLIKNCYSCFIQYPIDPWCIDCVNGYYVQLEDGTCVPCPDSCASCIQQHSIYQDSWKTNIRAIYYYLFGSHKFEDFAIDDINKYEIVCTGCKDDYILSGKSCIPGCTSKCQVCEAKEGKAVCIRCKDNQFGALRSLDSNQQCIDCPQHCYACVPRNSYLWDQISYYFNSSMYLNYQNYCFSFDQNYFLDNQYNLPVKCDNSKKCFKSLRISINIYCDQNFDQIISNCQFLEIQTCLQNIFNEELTDYIKKSVIKEVEIILIMKFSLCLIKDLLNITQSLKENVYTINSISLIVQTSQQTTIHLYDNIVSSNFDRYQISNLTILAINTNIKFELRGLRVQFQSIVLEDSDHYFSQICFILTDIIELEINNFTVLPYYRVRFAYLIQIRNLQPYTSNISIMISNVFINSNQYFEQGFLNITIQNVSLTLDINNLTIVDTRFENCSSFFNFVQGVKVSSIMKNISLISNKFLNSSFIQWSQITGSPYFQMIVQDNHFKKSILISVPVIDIRNSTFLLNQLIDKSIFIQSFSNGTFDSEVGLFNFQYFHIKQNNYSEGSQFICINQLEKTNIQVNFEEYISMDNKQSFVNTQLSYEHSLIYINISKININNFIITRQYGIIELAIIQSQQIFINNLTIENQYKNNIIYSDQSCLKQQQNIIIYIFDAQNLVIDIFKINQMGSIDFSIIIIQSQSRLKKQQNETIIIQNGIISNNLLAISEYSKQISVIEINSFQQQEIRCRNIIFVRNILNLYVQNLQIASSSTIMIQSDQGHVQFDGCIFEQNFVINSTNSPFYVYSNQIQITNSNFLNNNIFNLDLFKQFIQLSYLDEVSVEQIQLKDFPIQSNGGSVSLKAQQINISNIDIQGSYGLNGASFYIQTVGQSIINIQYATIKNSFTSDDINSKGGVLFIDGLKSNLQINLENIQVFYAKSRQFGGFSYILSSDLQIKILNLDCINCFSTNGGLIYIDNNELSSNVYLNNINIENPDFIWFFSNIFNITSNEQVILQRYSYLIYLPDSSLSLFQLKVTNGNLFGILYFKGIQGLIIEGLQISNYNSFYTPLITITHPQITQNMIQIKNIQIFNIYQEETQKLECKPATMKFDSYMNCQQEMQPEEIQTFTQLTKQFIDNNFNCNYQNVYQTTQQRNALIEVFNFTNNLLLMDDFQIYNSSCDQVEIGLISIRDFAGIGNQVKINNLQMINNSCGNYGCLLIASLSQNILNLRILSANVYEFLKLQTSCLYIWNSKFIQNQAIQGAGIYIHNVSVMIINTLFINNKAEELGGAIYFRGNINNLLLINNQIINNQALNQSGSGLYLDGITMSKLDGLQNIFIDNQQDFNEIPQKLQILFNSRILTKLTIKNDSQQLIEQVHIQPYRILGQQQTTNVIMLPSGQSIKDYQYFDQQNQQYIPYNLSLQFIPINRLGQQLYDQQIDLYLSARNNNNPFSSKKYFNKNIFAFDKTTQTFNLDDLIIYYSPYESNYLEIKVESPDIIIPQYSTKPPYNIKSYQNYELRFMIKTFKCQLGQFYDVNTQYCQQCTGNTYSVQLNSRICVFKDDNFINEVNSAMIQLKAGYWRAYVFSPKIDYCYNLEENCIGGWGTGNQLCSLGHIGALCEQCDLYNIRGSGSYSVSSLYSCGSCQESRGNILSVILISLWTMISIVMTVQSTIDLIDNQIQRRQLIKICLNYSDQKPNPAVLIKVFSNYLQIIITITTFQLQLPPEISTVFVSAGNPISTMAFSLDCFLVGLSQINIIYFRIIWGILLSFSYIFIYQLGYLILVIAEKIKFNISAVTTCFIYLYVYLQPNLISSLISLISYREISGQQWIAGNVSYRYDTSTHTRWLISFVVPSLIIIGIMIPTILFFGLYKNRRNLNYPKNKYIWGYLYNEYKLTTYYWETIKIVEKQFIIIVLAYYEDYIPIKAALVFICLFLYSQATQICQPYNQGMFNKIDTQSTTVCAVSIILATTIYTAQLNSLNEIIWPFYLIISILNALFFSKLLWFLIYAYGLKFQNQLDLIRDKIITKFPDSVDRFPFLKIILENQQSRKKRIHLRFQKIRQFLLPQAKQIIEIKNSTKITLSTKSKEKENRDTSYIHNKEIITSPLHQEKILYQDELLNKNQTE